MRPKSHTFIIASDGQIPLGIALFLWMLSLWLEFLPWVFFLMLVGLLWVYRNPERIPDEDDSRALLAPIDGKICAIEQSKFTPNGEKFLCVSIEGSAYGVGVLRAPNAFTCKEISTKDGLNLPHDLSQAKILNSRIKLHCETKNGDFWLGVQAGPWVKQISSYGLNRPIKMGARFGFGLGSKVSLYLPYSARIRANIGDKVYGGESVIGYLQGDKNGS